MTPTPPVSLNGSGGSSSNLYKKTKHKNSAFGWDAGLSQPIGRPKAGASLTQGIGQQRRPRLLWSSMSSRAHP